MIDLDLIRQAEDAGYPVRVWYIMHLYGGPAGLAHGQAWMHLTAQQEGCEAFMWRTNQDELTSLAERWGGVSGFCEEDGRVRWWVPASAVPPLDG